VKEILEAKAHNLLSISPQASVLDALKLMAEKDIGARLRAQGDFARQILQGYAGERDHDAQGCVRAPRAERRGAYGADDRQAYPAPSRTGNQKVIGVISIGDVVKEVISEQRFVIEQLEQYIHS
jgi:CBS domain-containing protein